MVDSINVTGLTVAGRIDAPDPKNGQVAIQKNLDMSNAASFSIDFNSVNQQQTIGVIRTLFADNTSNPSEIVVTALGTGQRFTIPAFAEGYFPIISRLNAGIVLTTDGGATAPIGVTFFNYDIPSVVWYKYGAVNKDIAQRVQGALVDGDDAAGIYSRPNLVAGKSPTGKVKTLATDANGALLIANLNVTIGAIFGPDNVGAAPTHPGVLIAGLDSGGNVRNFAFNAANELKTKDTDVATKLDTLITNGDEVEGILKTIRDNARSTGSTRANVAASIAAGGVMLLAANANRRGAAVTNDSTAILYLSANSGAVSVTDYTVQVLPGSYYEVPANYTGDIKGLWSAANGNARVTEFI